VALQFFVGKCARLKNFVEERQSGLSPASPHNYLFNIRRKTMPWNKKTFKKHNQKLTDEAAEKASAQANAILEDTGDEGMAIAVANKQAGLRRQGAKKTLRKSRGQSGEVLRKMG
jgi:hypothetical protein